MSVFFFLSSFFFIESSSQVLALYWPHIAYAPLLSVIWVYYLIVRQPPYASVYCIFLGVIVDSLHAQLIGFHALIFFFTFLLVASTVASGLFSPERRALRVAVFLLSSCIYGAPFLIQKLFLYGSESFIHVFSQSIVAALCAYFAVPIFDSLGFGQMQSRFHRMHNYIFSQKSQRMNR